ncbi:hypothetical protein CMO83_05160 [Candidatus Woesearchaeota archaeon]|jgi:hypothetical protein|nr:hypothetical protein [Candidatus Woesearchaeota archaeon]|tara:strand:- start:21093 stop:21410 length:318 start_codon:yes stop_codon:yes gene_type:complete
MPKKKKSEVKDILNKYVQDFLSFLLVTLEEGTGSLFKKFSNLLSFKRRLQHTVVALVILIAALGIIFYGLGLFLESFFPKLRPGIMHILIGVVFILIALAYKKYY